MQHAGKIATVAIGLGLCYWLTLPPSDLALDSSCHLTDVQARISEALYGTAFWQAQRESVDRELALLQTLSAKAESGEGRTTVSPIESRMDRLSNAESAGSSAERDEALAREQRERFDQMGHLMTCREVIVRHVVP